MATTFIIIVSLIIFACIALAVIVGFFMHTNNGLNSGEPEQASDVQANTTPTHNITGPLPPFILNPTQPLSEIYYHDEQTPTPEPLMTQSQPSQPLQPPNIPFPPGPQPTGPLPIYHNNQ